MRWFRNPGEIPYLFFYAICGGEYGTAITRNVSLQRFANHSRCFGFGDRKSLF